MRARRPSTQLRNGKYAGLALVGTALLVPGCVRAQAPQPASTPSPAEASPPQAVGPAASVTATGGTIHGSVRTGTSPLPGVAITATNTLTGKRYATSTDVDGTYAMTIPRAGRYVVRAEFAAFAPVTNEVRITAEAANQVAEFKLELASRAAQAQVAATQRTRTLGTGGQRSTMTLDMQGDTTGVEAATAGGAAAAAGVPSLAGLAGGDATASADSVTVTGVTGSTNGLAGFSEDEIRNRIQDALNNTRQQGGATNDQIQAVVGMLGGMLSGPPPGGPGGRGGGGRGGRGGGGGGGGAFRNFNPAQPHGSVFYQGGNNALNSAPWSPTLEPVINPSAYSNRFGASIAGSPYLPGLTKPDTRQFVFINLTGQKNLNPFLPNPVRVPTVLERTGDFSQSFQRVSGGLSPVALFDPATGLPIPGNNLRNSTVGISPQALALLSYYPQCNINCGSNDPTVFNYQTISNAGANNVAINTRYQRQLGQQTGGGPFGGFGGGGGRGGGGGGGGRNANAPPVLRQNINASFNYSHNANDDRNIFLPLGGTTASDGNALNLGYVVSYGRLSNNASVNWNRSSSETQNYFTDSATNPTQTANLNIPNQAQSFANPHFYNGVPSLNITNFAGLSNTTPVQSISQTISFSDFVAWRHKRHNFRLGLDIRRVHADSVGGNNPLGSFTFTGYATASPAYQVAGLSGSTAASGSGFADFLLGLPESTSIQAGIYKTYLRENVYDWYVTDDFRVKSNVTLNYGLRYEYFGPYTEKNNRLVNLDHNASYTAVQTVFPGGTGAYGGQFPSSLIRPDRTMFEPRFGGAWSPRFAGTKNVVVRAGYGLNFNTGQYRTFAELLSHQVPFAVTQNNVAATPTSANPAPAATGCTTTQAPYPYMTSSGASAVRPATTANLTLSNGFGCSTAQQITNNWAVDPNYRLGMVQIYNLNVQKTIPLGIVLNVGYNGSKGSDLDLVGSPNGTPAGTTTPGIAPFDYERSIAGSHSNQLVLSAQKRQQKGIAVGFTYVYSHTIDNASGVAGAIGTPIQNFYRPDLEEGNSTFDQRHNLTGNWVLELPFGPNREFLSKGGLMAKALDGFSLSGTFTFATGTYFTPQYSGNQAEASAANTFNQRPNRVAGTAIKGAGQLKGFFNTSAFTLPASGQYGTASQGSIEGPGTVATNAALSRTFQLGGTNSFEARVTATNVFNTVQYNGINVTENSANFGQVTSAAAMRSLQVQARYRF